MGAGPPVSVRLSVAILTTGTGGGGSASSRATWIAPPADAATTAAPAAAAAPFQAAVARNPLVTAAPTAAPPVPAAPDAPAAAVPAAPAALAAPAPADAGAASAPSGNSAARATAAPASARTPRDSQSLPYAAAAADSSHVTNAAAPGGRSAGSFAVPLATRGRRGSGTSATSTGAVRCWFISATRSPANGRRPVTHSTNTHVAAYTSAAGVAGSPRHCSGAMYRG